ncbi:MULTISPECIES: TlpA disulfide reductase family protein [unclassified Treponema]|uniref:TlpA disulfide reductase family protein n=1 Tax=unclassified Treponema TaxID=2638727 RepID=UPI0020A5BDA7|nr:MULTISPECIES: TlpA disulfide reductase family protein [unclassified Treponema]UTC67451.1 TlpA family protein disulfide reductase [Treponema sp. OMZ 789]UTC70179.1 TlpA family protein disulfide reductase [Treponema sp. OMZ 790]UTC72894.1 TlpA family protein disulfide reductase [Treponema sp. OMZ 791]
MKKLNFYLLIAIFASLFFMSCTKADAKGNEEAKTSEAATSAEAKTADDDQNRLIFSTKDLDGNPVTNDIFEKYDVTLVNIWGTFCGPCKVELPDLEAAYKAYADKKVNVIALTADLQEGDAETLTLAKELWKDAGCTFKALVTVDNFLPIYEQITGVPTSFLVDKNGKLIPGTIHTGRLNKAGFETLFDTALKAVASN